jgi:hypothetical protein
MTEFNFLIVGGLYSVTALRSLIKPVTRLRFDPTNGITAE